MTHADQDKQGFTQHRSNGAFGINYMLFSSSCKQYSNHCI